MIFRENELDLNALSAKVKEAKHRKFSHGLQGDTRHVIFYLYSEILTSIEQDMISKKIMNAHKKLFSLEFHPKKVFISTICKSVQHVKAFDVVDTKETDLFSAIESAMNFIGLRVKKESFKDTYEIYFQPDDG